MNDIENAMVVDLWCEEVDYNVPDQRRMKRQRQAYEEAEREDMEDE